jgi:hypothetical protein
MRSRIGITLFLILSCKHYEKRRNRRGPMQSGKCADLSCRVNIVVTLTARDVVG